MTYSVYERCYSCAGKAQPGAVAILKYLMNKYSYTKSLGIYNCRYISGTSTLSNHSCGTAVDLFIPHDGWGEARPELGNPIVQFLDSISSDIGLTEQIYNRVRYDRGTPRGKYYGGRHPHHDHIHFSLTKDKGQSLTYAQLVSVAGDPIPGKEDEMALKKGDKGPAVKKLQVGLMNERSNSLPEWGADSDFGSETEAAVKNYQNRAKLPVTGQADGVTMALLLEYVADRVGGGSVDNTARSSANEALKLAQQIRDKLKSLY